MAKEKGEREGRGAAEKRKIRLAARERGLRTSSERKRKGRRKGFQP